MQGSVDDRGFNRCASVCVCMCANIRKQNKTFNSFIKGFNTQLRPITFFQIAFSHSNTSPGLESRFSETAIQKKPSGTSS